MERGEGVHEGKGEGEGEPRGPWATAPWLAAKLLSSDKVLAQAAAKGKRDALRTKTENLHRHQNNHNSSNNNNSNNRCKMNNIRLLLRDLAAPGAVA